MPDWVSLVEEALNDLGGRNVCVPGAQLHSEVSKRVSKEGTDFGADLRGQGITFRQYLERFESLTVHVRPGADMLVGFHGASLPTQPERPAGGPREFLRIRDDVYSAFTRISPTPFVYVHNVDRFTTEPGDEADTVQVPPVTLEGLVGHRRAFVTSVEDDQASDELKRSIERSANPLADFQRTVIALRLSRRWHDFSYRAVRSEIEAWAKESGLEVPEAWFSPLAQAQPPGTPLDVLVVLGRHMTEEEIRGLAVPFRAVEELYRALARKRRP